MEKTYFTYVLLCADQTYYCGFTNDLDKRLAAHNSGKGAKYTRLRRPVSLISHVAFDNEHEARSCEWWFKHKLSRAQKTQLIKTDQIKMAYLGWQEKRGS